jgi:flagella basal body P-ring formation protein FlgA
MHNNITIDSGDHLAVEVGQIDDRLKLKNCPQGHLQVFNPYPGTVAQTNTLGVKCNDEAVRWTLYVSVTTKIEKMILVAKRNLPQRHMIEADDIYLARQDIVPLKYGWFTKKEDVVGKLSKQNIDINRPITPVLLAKETLVQRGDQVTIKADTGSIHISMTGKALSKGSQGDIIRVQNLKSKRIVQAEVTGPREVRVTI